MYDPYRNELVVAREGFVPVRCRCGTVLQMPTGPDFWERASGGRIALKPPYFTCVCGFTITEVGPGDLA